MVWRQVYSRENGPKLANLITAVKNTCPNSDIRLLAHSLGARVVLSSLDSLHKNQIWNKNNFTIKSVDLLGATVDDEEVSTNPQDILIDQTNWGIQSQTMDKQLKQR